MKALDYFLQTWRIKVAGRHIAPGSRVLDVGCSDGVLFRKLDSIVSEGVGVDPDLPAAQNLGKVQLVAGNFPDALKSPPPFDAITMLAVFEHVPEEDAPRWAKACADLLKPGGKLIITVPSPLVDHILEALKFLRILDGMSLEQHHGFEPDDTPRIFSSGPLHLILRETFQLGLNNLFIFQKKPQS